MPLARIDINRDAPAERVRIVSEAVYGAMIDIANVPVNDMFQVVTRHSVDEIIYPHDGYLGIRYSPDLIIIQVTWVVGRPTDIALPTKFTPKPASVKRTSGSTWWMTHAKTGRSATAICNTHRNRSQREAASARGKPNDRRSRWMLPLQRSGAIFWLAHLADSQACLL
jgi:hypothetical protein